MKYYWLFKWILIIFFIPANGLGQALSSKAFFSMDSIPALYLGIDFTQAKLINDEVSDPVVIQEQQFHGINFLMLKEPKKYDFKEAYHRINWTDDLTQVNDRNKKTNPDMLKSRNDSDLYRWIAHDIDTMVSHFNFGSHKGYGILIIVEGMSKSKKIMTSWFTLINMNSKLVLYTDMLEGELGTGFGFRNYWATAIKSSIHQVKRTKYDEWKRSLGTK